MYDHLDDYYKRHAPIDNNTKYYIKFLIISCFDKRSKKMIN